MLLLVFLLAKKLQVSMQPPYSPYPAFSLFHLFMLQRNAEWTEICIRYGGTIGYTSVAWLCRSQRCFFELRIQNLPERWHVLTAQMMSDVYFHDLFILSNFQCCVRIKLAGISPAECVLSRGRQSRQNS